MGIAAVQQRAADIPRAADATNEAFLRAYCDHFDSLVRLAQRLVDRRDLAEEIAQETIARIISRQTQAQPGRELAYLRMAVLNLARSQMRRRQVAERWRPDAAPTPIWPDEVYLANTDSERIQAALTALSERQRAVISLRYLVGLSESETSQRLGISLGSVKAHASRGKSRLQAMLASDPVPAMNEAL